MITVSTMKKQVGRLLRLPFAPIDPTDLKGLAEEYRRILADCCKTDAHCESAVNVLMDNCARVPAPAELRNAANATAPERPEGFPGCAQCNYTGWQDYTGTDGYNYVRPCPQCRGKHAG